MQTHCIKTKDTLTAFQWPGAANEMHLIIDHQQPIYKFWQFAGLRSAMFLQQQLVLSISLGRGHLQIIVRKIIYQWKTFITNTSLPLSAHPKFTPKQNVQCLEEVKKTQAVSLQASVSMLNTKAHCSTIRKKTLVQFFFLIFLQ